MVKLFSMLAAAIVAVGFSAPARADLATELVLQLQESTMDQAARAGIDWHVGDKATYSLDMGFIKGTSVNSVREDTGTHFWMVQDVDLMIQKAKMEAMINKSTGQIDKLLMNGQEQSIPKSDPEIVEMKESQIKVAAGEFDCIYAKIKEKSDGKITEAWLNPSAVPMGGILKAVADSQIGKVTQELKSFSFANH